MSEGGDIEDIIISDDEYVSEDMPNIRIVCGYVSEVFTRITIWIM